MIQMDWEKADKGQYNHYFCSICRENKIQHSIINVPTTPTDSRSCWGPGVPAHRRRCTGCGFEDGPWVSAEHVGGGW